VTPRRVTFAADGLTLVGNLALAEAGASAVVLTGPFTAVKEQVVGTYAARLHERGVSTLAFDHRGFGESPSGCEPLPKVGGAQPVEWSNRVDDGERERRSARAEHDPALSLPAAPAQNVAVPDSTVTQWPPTQTSSPIRSTLTRPARPRAEPWAATYRSGASPAPISH
jgi:hypothetical protein